MPQQSTLCFAFVYCVGLCPLALQSRRLMAQTLPFHSVPIARSRGCRLEQTVLRRRSGASSVSARTCRGIHASGPTPKRSDLLLVQCGQTTASLPRRALRHIRQMSFCFVLRSHGTPIGALCGCMKIGIVGTSASVSVPRCGRGKSAVERMIAGARQQGMPTVVR